MKRNLGHLLLAIFLIVFGISAFVAAIPPVVTGGLAIAAGILLLLGK